jgi:hypothetical protein
MSYNIINEEQTMAKVSVEGARGTPCDLDGISLASARSGD